MITPVVMPQLGLEVTEGVVVELFVEPGTAVAKDTPLLELETDKASTDVVAPRDGVLRSWSVVVGDVVPVGDVLALLADTADEPLDGAAGAPVAAEAEVATDERVLAGVGAGARTEAAADGATAGADGGAVANGAGADGPTVGAPEPTGDGVPEDGAPRRRVAPIARRAAEDLGIALAAVEGTGPRGRVTLDDVRRAVAAREAGEASAVPAAAPTGAPATSASAARPDTGGRPVEPAGAAAPPVAPVLALAPDAGPEVVPMTATRRAIARRMSTSQLIPQYQLQRDVDASHLLAQKAAQSEGRNADARVGVNDLLVQAIAETVRRHPDLAVSWVDEDGGPRMVRSGADGVGLAAASDKGLVVPVIREPQTAGLAAIAEQRQRLVAAARGGTLAIADMSGAAITLSNLGGFGVDRFTAMLNPGESAIVAVGRTVERVVPRRGGTAVIPVLAVTVSFDHRVIDGAVGAAALGTLAELLEGGMTWRP